MPMTTRTSSFASRLPDGGTATMYPRLPLSSHGPLVLVLGSCPKGALPAHTATSMPWAKATSV
jgi:hypothetical protein